MLNTMVNLKVKVETGLSVVMVMLFLAGIVVGDGLVSGVDGFGDGVGVFVVVCIVVFCNGLVGFVIPSVGDVCDLDVVVPLADVDVVSVTVNMVYSIVDGFVFVEVDSVVAVDVGGGFNVVDLVVVCVVAVVVVGFVVVVVFIVNGAGLAVVVVVLMVVCWVVGIDVGDETFKGVILVVPINLTTWVFV